MDAVPGLYHLSVQHHPAVCLYSEPFKPCILTCALTYVACASKNLLRWWTGSLRCSKGNSGEVHQHIHLVLEVREGDTDWRGS